ncbi:MAG: pyrophosphatase PpaX [Bacillota bacterium]
MNKINTLLFDLDGTLVNTNEIIIESYKHAFNEHIPDKTFTRETIIDMIGPPLDEIFSKYTKSPFKVKKMIDTYRMYYKAHEHDYFYLYDNVYETLKKLKTMGYNMGIVTSKFLVSAQPSIEHFNLDAIFDVIVTLDDVDTPKPDKEPIEVALSQFDNVDKAIMIGDNASDILCAKNAGIFSAGVTWTIKDMKVLNDVDPDYILNTMDDLFWIIDTDF